MRVRDAIALLSLMPQDALLVGTDGPLRESDSPGSARLGVRVADPILSGFSAQEVRAEEWDLFLLEDSRLVVLAMTRNCAGEQM